jgi:hypothetical protein
VLRERGVPGGIQNMHKMQDSLPEMESLGSAKAQGPSKLNVEIKKQTMESSIHICALIEEHATDFNHVIDCLSKAPAEPAKRRFRLSLHALEEVALRTRYSDMIVHGSSWGMRGEGSSSEGTWTVMLDGPSHFFTSKAPTGATLLKRRHLELLVHALVIGPTGSGKGARVQGRGSSTRGSS